jgi:transcriptional regulator with XRE-family HTH domain
MFTNIEVITQQQLNKNESGANGLALGRLILIANALNKPATYFLEDVNQDNEQPTQHQRMCIEVARNFLKIKSPAVQISVNNHVRTLAQNS